MEKKNPTKTSVTKFTELKHMPVPRSGSKNTDNLDLESDTNTYYKANSKVESSVNNLPVTQIQEKIVYRNRKGGCFGRGLGCNSIGCIILLLLLLCCSGIIFTIINRPAVIWDRVVTYMNQGLDLPPYKAANADFVEENLVSNIKNGQNDIYITEDQLTTIGRAKLTQFKDLTFDLKSEELTMYWALDNNQNPIYADVKMKVENNTIEITKIGTPNLTLPAFTNETLNKLILSILNIKEKDGNGNLLNALLANDNNLKINKIEFQQDKLYLDVFINVSLFQ